MLLTDPRPAIDGIVEALRAGFGRNLEASVRSSANDAGLATDRVGEIVTADDLADLPGLVRRYFGYMDVAGRPRDTSVTVHARGRFLLRPRIPWLPYESWQLTTADPIARIFRLRIDAGLIPLIAAYDLLEGRGTMKAGAFGLVPLADSSGAELDVGELVTWLNDAVLLAPSMLLRPEVEWAALDERSFGVTVTDHGVSATARVVLNEDGSPRTFETFDRYVDVGHGIERARWATPVRGWTTEGGHRRFTSGAAIWELPDGDFPYVVTRLRPGAVVHGRSRSVRP